MDVKLSSQESGYETIYTPSSVNDKKLAIDIGDCNALLETEFFQPEHDSIEESLSLTNAKGTYQDLVLVRPTKDRKSIEVLVWADAKDENYTNRFVIPIDLEDTI